MVWTNVILNTGVASILLDHTRHIPCRPPGEVYGLTIPGPAPQNVKNERPKIRAFSRHRVILAKSKTVVKTMP